MHVSVHAGEYYSAMKMGEALTLATMWMDLEHAALSREARHTGTHRVCVIPLT